MKIIVHPGTATILNASECVIVDLEALSLDALTEHVATELWSLLEEGLDLQVAELAEKHGTPVA